MLLKPQKRVKHTSIRYTKEIKISVFSEAKESLHPWVKVDQAGRHLPPKQLSILEGLTLNLVHTLCRSLRNWNDLDFGCL